MKKISLYVLLFLSVTGVVLAAPPFTAQIIETTPTMANATSVTMVVPKEARKYLLIQNNSAANICCSLSGNVLTGIAPTATNKCFVITAGGSIESNSIFVTSTSVTCYQASGGTINTVTVGEG